MTDRNPSRELEELLKKQSRSAKEWAYSISGAFWQNKGQVVDDEYLFVCLANAMMSMHDSIFNKEIKNLEEEIAKLKCVNDKYLDTIQAKNMNESFLESEIVSLKKQLEKENEQLKQKLEALKELVGEAINERMITEASSYNDWSERETAWTKRAAELLGQTND